MTELRNWRQLDPETRPRFVDDPGRRHGPVDRVSPLRIAERKGIAELPGNEDI